MTIPPFENLFHRSQSSTV